MIYQYDRKDKTSIELESGEVSMAYKCANTRKCYWLCRDCLKGHKQCSPKCPDYLSVAKVKRLAKEKNR